MRAGVSSRLLVCVVLAHGCGGDDGPPAGPFDDLALTRDIRLDGIDGAAHVVRDRYGIPHIWAESLSALSFAQGYVTAHDRLPQMDILRRFGAGTLSELYGGLEPDVVESDLEMRMHRMRPLAEEAHAELQASDDPVDAEILEALGRFADGVNAYHADLLAGKYGLDYAVRVTFDPERFEPWTVVDSLVLGRYQAYSLSWSAEGEIDLTDIYQEALAVFDDAAAPGEPGHDPARYARRGAARDLARLTPIGRTPTVDGFPPREASRGRNRQPSSPHAARPHVPRELLARARALMHGGLRMGPHAFASPLTGSNNWAVHPSLADGKALLAGDQHLLLANPPIFYPVHLFVPGEVNTVGVTFPGIPGVILGHNGTAAWSATVVDHDVNDVYLEQIAPCSQGSGDCVLFDGGEVAIETWEEVVEIGVLGTITETMTVTYEMVPHHGPIFPIVEDRQLVPRTGDQALSVRYTGHSVSNEIRAIHRLVRAGNAEEAIAAIEYFDFGGQNWTIIDNSGSVGWTTHAKIPLRDPNAYSWDPVDNPKGLAPFLVLPGDGSAEWEGFLDPAYIPGAIDPAQGYIVTANADPVGATFDGNPLNETVVDGRPLYYGALYVPGLRAERITAMLLERIDSAQAVTLEDLATIQADSTSTVGTHLQSPLAPIIASIDESPKPDVSAWLAGLTTAEVDRLRAAGARLSDWTLATPPAVQGSPTAAEKAASVATTIFNVWAHFFLSAAIGDEMTALGWDIYELDENRSSRVIAALLEEPDSLGSGLAAETNQPILCDDMTTSEVIESCDRVALQALHEALDWLSSDEGLATDDMSQWHWGRLHTLTLEPLFPEATLDIPPPDDPDPALRKGYPRAGDNFVVNRADCGWNDRDFAQDPHGPAQRYLAEVDSGGVVSARMSLPGGTIYHRESPHYRDLVDEYYIPNRHFDVPYAIEEILANAEERWVLRK